MTPQLKNMGLIGLANTAIGTAATSQPARSGIGMAAASSSGGLFRGMWDQIFARRTQERTLAANKELADYQYSQDLEQWNRANQYNSPIAQMERLKAAGLNPNLVYGKGISAAGNTATQLPKYNSPTAKFEQPPLTGVGTMLSQYQDYQVRQAQTDLLHEQVNKTREDTYGRTLNNQLAELINGIKVKIAGAGLKGKQADAQLKSINAGEAVRRKAQNVYEQLDQMELTKTQHEVDKADAQARKIMQDAIQVTMENAWMKNTGLKGSDAIVKLMGMLGGGLMFRGLGMLRGKGFVKGAPMKKLKYSPLRPYEIKKNRDMANFIGTGFFK